MEQAVLKIWREVLNRTQIDPISLSSTRAARLWRPLTVLSRYFQLNWSLTLAQFYEHATVQEQAALLKGSSLEQPKTGREEEFEQIFLEPVKTVPDAAGKGYAGGFSGR